MVDIGIISVSSMIFYHFCLVFFKRIFSINKFKRLFAGRKGGVYHEEKIEWQYDLLPKIYAFGAEIEGEYGFPKLPEQEFVPEGDVFPINYMLSSKALESSWFHCFVDDYQFERLWRGYEKYIVYIRKCSGFIASDFSLYRDDSKNRQVWNCMRNRALTYAMIRDCPKTPIIPTAGFGNEETWDWCFDGLPHHSTVAITTNGVLSELEAKRLFVGGIDALVKSICPSNIVVCGKYPQWLEQKYPDINIIYVPNYNQLSKIRRCL